MSRRAHADSSSTLCAVLLAAATASLFVHGCATSSDAASGGASSGSGAASSGAAAGFGGSAATAGSGGTIVYDAASDVFDPDAEGCATSTAKAEFVPANLLLVVDKSTSMRCNPPPTQSSTDCEAMPVTADTAQPTKWTITRDALKTAISGMPGTSSVGIEYFPIKTICEAPVTADVPVKVLTAGQRTLLQQSLDALQPVGKTPLVASLGNSYIYLENLTLTGNRFVVLITDGAESCSGDPAGLISQVSAKAQAGIRTFVIGAPGSETFRATLSDVAFAGGTAPSSGCVHGGSQPDVGDCHFDMTTVPSFAQSLNQALESISGSSISCEFDVPAKAPNGDVIQLDRVNVKYTPGDGQPATYIKPDASGACTGPDGGAGGWQYIENNTKIVLCGAVCDTVKRDPTARVDIVFGCQTIPA